MDLIPRGSSKKHTNFIFKKKTRIQTSARVSRHNNIMCTKEPLFTEKDGSISKGSIGSSISEWVP